MFLVCEIQNNNGTVAQIVTTHTTRNEAESKYHTVLAYAAVSQVQIHSAILFTDEGFPIMYQCYKHSGIPSTPVVPDVPEEPEEGGEETPE